MLDDVDVSFWRVHCARDFAFPRLSRLATRFIASAAFRIFKNDGQMALQSQNQAFHNRMLGQRSVQSRLSQSVKGEAEAERGAKRLKTQHSSTSSETERTEIRDSDADDEEDIVIPTSARTNGLESALPDIRTDQEAIDEYEAQRAAEQCELKATKETSNEHVVRGKSSIYLDAFNLALQTVLEEESHLFDDAEKALFVHWNSLGYEAQYLFVPKLLPVDFL